MQDKCKNCVHYNQCKAIIHASLYADEDDTETKMRLLLCEKPFKPRGHRKICAYCGREFIAKSIDRVYCSHACSSKAYNERKKRGARIE